MVNFSILLEKLKKISSLRNGEVSFDGIEILNLEWTFLSLINFENFYNIECKKEILYNTFNELVINDKFDREYFNEVLKNKIAQHNNKKERDYFLLASLSVNELPIQKALIGKSIIKICGKQFPKKFRVHRNNIIKINNGKPEVNDCLKVVVTIKAQDFRDAYEKAYRSFEVFRALLCLILNNKLEIRFGPTSGDPINKIRHGEYFSLHHENGHCVDNNYLLSDPNFKLPKLLNLTEDKLIKLKPVLKSIIKRYNLCSDKHRGTLSKALIIYVGAFDEPNKYLCFLRAWTALETILKSDDNDTIIKRCTSLYNDDLRLYYRQILEGLRKYRNEFVHEGENGLDPFIACFNIQSFIYNLIISFNFKYAGFFNNIDDSTMFLDNYNQFLRDLKVRKKVIDKVISLKENIGKN